MTLSSDIRRTEEQKLATLRRLDRFRRWHSLDDERYCLHCAQIITGHMIQVTGGHSGDDGEKLICPTQGCRSIPMDWVLPTAETKPTRVIATDRDAAAARPFPESRPKGHPIRGSLRRLAMSFRRST
jgi:hypothetical protein